MSQTEIDIIDIANACLTRIKQNKICTYKEGCYVIPVNEMKLLSQGFLLAYDCLRNHEHLVRGECLEACDMCQTLKAVRSLPPS